jgi:hypothetical protein
LTNHIFKEIKNLRCLTHQIDPRLQCCILLVLSLFLSFLDFFT